MPEDEQDRPTSTRPFWSGTITFGLVSIPVNLFPANRQGGIHLRLLGPEGAPLSRHYSSDDIVRGYEIEKDRYVLITDEELERLAPDKSRDIDLRKFVPSGSIPPRYFNRGYFLAPAEGSAKAYKLLAKTMEATGRIGIATFVMRGKEYLVAILAESGILRAETLRFHDELRSARDVGLPEKPKLTAAATRKFEKIIDSESASRIDAKHLKDQEAERLLKIVDKKRKQSKNVVEVETEEAGEKPSNVVDLMETLRRSLAGKATRPKARARTG